MKEYESGQEKPSDFSAEEENTQSQHHRTDGNRHTMEKNQKLISTLVWEAATKAGDAG